MILLTGATGFLGSKLLKRLIAEKYEVVCVKRTTSDCDKVRELYSCCKWINIDEENVETAFQKYDIETVIHCATNYGRKRGTYLEVYESNLGFPLSLLKYAQQYGCRYFINTDTFFVKEIDVLWTNNEPVYMNDYVKSKYIFTNIVKDHISEMNLSFINLQLEHIYGQDDGAGKFVDYLIRNLSQNVTAIELTEGVQQRDWTYIEDVLSAYKVVLEKQEDFQEGVFYHFEVGTGKATSLREFVETVKKLANSTTKLEFGKRQMNANELEKSWADNRELCKLGWNPCYDIVRGIQQMLKR